MGTTYKAEDTHESIRVAMKVVSLQRVTDWKVLELFDREARVLSNLNHPQIPNYLAQFKLDTDDDRRFYLIQEIAPGQSLETLVKRGWQPTETEVKRLLFNVLEILDYLHSLHPPVIHRDIKPQNIMRDDDGSVYLVDFGAVQDVYRNTLTRGGTFVGTLGYMAHEQFRGEVCAASDLYGLGTTALFVLSGKPPDSFPQKRLKLQFRDRISVSPKFADWLEKILEPSVEDRFASAKEALNALQRASTVSQSPISLNSIDIDRTNSTWGGMQKTDGYVAFVLPSNRLKARTIKILYFIVFIAFAISSISSGNFAAFSAVTLMSWILVGLILVVAFGTDRWLIVDRKQFQLKWRFGKFTYWKKQGQSEDLDLVEVEVQTFSSKKGKTTMKPVLCLWEGVRPHYFGSGLYFSELSLIAQNIQDFLGLDPL